MTFMTHPQHGANNVSPSDVEAQEKAGWKVTDRAEWMALKGKVATVEEVEPEQPEPIVIERKKPGPKPKAK